MFTGIVEEKGLVLDIRQKDKGVFIRLGASKILTPLNNGDSVAVNGVCLTVTHITGDSFAAWAMPETLTRTNLAYLSPGQMVNLERALMLGERLGGHFVSGHVDEVIVLNRVSQEGGATILSFAASMKLLRYIIFKGSVALDGVSLTVTGVNREGFSVGVVPHTASETTLGGKTPGSKINLEVDMLGKYIDKLIKNRLNEDESVQEAISESMLREKGFL